MKFSKLLSLSSLFLMFSVSTVFAMNTATVSENRVNLRDSASLNSTVIDQLNSGTSLNVVGRNGEWIRIVHGDRGHVYINGDFVSFSEVVARITVTGVNVRELPNTSANIIGRAMEGDSIIVTSYVDDWFEIIYNGIVAYVHSEFVEGEFLDFIRESELNNTSLAPESTYAVVAPREGLNLRAEPSTTSRILFVMPPDDVMDVLEVNGEWARVDLDGTIGYANIDFIDVRTGARPSRPDSVATVLSPRYAISTPREGLNLRSQPSTTSRVLFVIPPNDVMNVLEVNGEWARVDLDGIVGYANMDFIDVRRGEMPVRNPIVAANPMPVVTPSVAPAPMPAPAPVPVSTPISANPNKGAEVIAFARQFLGNPYVWGGTSLTHGADCSGFVQSVMRNFGIYLNRVSRDQARNGVEVARSELIPGDLVFFGRGVIGHVGIYAGHGSFIHSSDYTRGIIMSYLSRRNDFVTARRVIN